jgi:hypothetical protein
MYAFCMGVVPPLLLQHVLLAVANPAALHHGDAFGRLYFHSCLLCVQAWSALVFVSCRTCGSLLFICGDISIGGMFMLGIFVFCDLLVALKVLFMHGRP